MDTDKCYANLAAEVHCDTLDAIDAPEEKDRVSKLCIKAANEALQDAGLGNFADDQRVSVIIGSCVGGVISVEHYHQNGKNANDIPKMPRPMDNTLKNLTISFFSTYLHKNNKLERLVLYLWEKFCKFAGLYSF